jgi:hypothetical protein
MDAILSQTLDMPKPTPAPQASRDRNALFAYDAGESAHPCPFANTRRITLATRDGQPIGLEVAAGAGAAIETLFDEKSGCCAYLWGVAGHCDVPAKDLLRWIVEKVNSGDHAALRDVVGIFVVLIDDRRNGRVKMVSDPLGMRPWFVGRHNGKLVCGSDVWLIQESGLSGVNRGGVNYDAVASWLMQNYDCTDQSLFADYSAIGPGVVATWEDGKYIESPYAQFTGAQNRPEPRDLVEAIHNGVCRAFDAATGDLDHVTIALSGGYDSRYLAALASRRKDLKLEAFSVRDREAEALAAQMVAQRLGLTMQVLATDGSRWNMYDEPYHFTPGGFPMTKQLSFLAACQRPDVPCLNGFIGDPIIRGTLDRTDGKLEPQIQDLAAGYQRSQRVNHSVARFDLLDPAVLARADERNLATWRRHVNRWQNTGHAIFALGVFVRQRHYLSNNFLQHMDVAEALIPFAAWDVVQYKLQTDPTVYSFATYDALFQTFFPEIADVPHNSKMGEKNAFVPKPSRCTKEWAAKVLKGLSTSQCLPLLSRRKSVPRLIGTLLGSRDLEVVALFLYRLFLLDQRLRRAGVEFDWKAI